MPITINNQKFDFEKNDTILKVCKKNGIEIPTLCAHLDLVPEGRCRICIVEANGKIVTSCDTLAEENMEIVTENEKIKNHIKLMLELMIANSDDILDGTDNEINKLAKKYNVKSSRFNKSSVDKSRFDSERYKKTYKNTLKFDNNKCINCGRCVQKCQIIQEVFAIGYEGRSFDTCITPYLRKELTDTVCVLCGQCSLSCPTGAIADDEVSTKILEAIKDPKKHVIVQPAPSIRASIGEMQGLPVGTKVTYKLVTALKKLGFDKVVDTDFAADLTILEEGTELINRIKNKKPLPQFTSCSPGWVLFLEHFYPELLPNMSSCKSPQQMMGTLIKTYYAKKHNIDPKNIVSVAIMPCTAKKFEAQRPEMNDSGFQDVDIVITTRELGKLLNKQKIIINDQKETPFDSLMGISTGAGVIFAVTGGVMEAALRYAADVLEDKSLTDIEYTEVRGLDGIKQASIPIAGMTVNVAVAHGLANAHKLVKHVKENPNKYHFVEIMACPGGCIGGGGQPLSTNKKIVEKRTKAIYEVDKDLPIRKSQDNPEIKQIYNDFLGEIGGEMAHKLLHTKYTKRNRY
jgi:NADP-reducing hydrogenase subunit HndD